jgi:hypothetical protein
MTNREEVFRQLSDSFHNMGEHFHILDHRVPVEQQLEYFSYTYKLRKRKRTIKEGDYDKFIEKLGSVTSPKEEKKKILALLGASSEIRAYRLLEQYMQAADEELVNWATMALMESRIMIESELSGERLIYISTGLGGKEGKMRFYVLIPSVKMAPFKPYQREVIEKEFTWLFPKNDCEIERLSIRENYVELVALLPMSIQIHQMMEFVVSECNIYGNFLSGTLTMTNVKELTQDEVNEVLAMYKKSLRKR